MIMNWQMLAALIIIIYQRKISIKQKIKQEISKEKSLDIFLCGNKITQLFLKL